MQYIKVVGKRTRSRVTCYWGCNCTVEIEREGACTYFHPEDQRAELQEARRVFERMRNFSCPFCERKCCRHGERCWRGIRATGSDYSSGEDAAQVRPGRAVRQRDRRCREQADWERARCRKPSPRVQGSCRWRPNPRDREVWVEREGKSLKLGILLHLV